MHWPSNQSHQKALPLPHPDSSWISLHPSARVCSPFQSHLHPPPSLPDTAICSLFSVFLISASKTHLTQQARQSRGSTLNFPCPGPGPASAAPTPSLPLTRPAALVSNHSHGLSALLRFAPFKRYLRWEWSNSKMV